MPRKGQAMSAEQRAKIRAAWAARPLPTAKRCSRCKVTKPAAAFRWRTERTLDSWCKDCKSEYAKTPERRADSVRKTQRYIDRTPELDARRASINRVAQLKRKYGVTPEEYDELLDEQDYGCAICESPDPGRGHQFLAVDHNHSTQQTRGLLCHACNRALGLFGDDAQRVQRAASYLLRYASAGKKGATQDTSHTYRREPPFDGRDQTGRL